MQSVLTGESTWAVAEGDCLSLLREVGDGCADFVFTDPPYGNTGNGSLQQRWEAVFGWQDGVGVYRDESAYAPLVANDGPEANDLFRAVLPELRRVIAPGSCCCCCCGGGGPRPQFAWWSLWLAEVFDFKQMVVWDKGPMGMGWHYRRSYETVLVGQKPGAACRWYDTSHKVENIIRPGNGIRKIIPRKDQHPTQKPAELAEHFIRLHTQPGDLVLDPFCGSGSTGVAAVRLGRRFLGMELSPEYCAMARARIAHAERATPAAPTLFASAGGGQ